MVPPPDKPLDLVEQQRWQLTKTATGLIALGVPPDLVMLDARDGVELGQALERERARR